MATVKGIWVLSPSSFTDISQSVSFTSNGQNYTSFNVTTSGVKFGSSYVYTRSSWSWTNNAYRVVDFGTIEQTVTDTFYAWLKQNAMEGGVTSDLAILNLAVGSHIITVRAEAEGYDDSADSNAVSYEVVADELAGTWVYNDTVSLLSDGTEFIFRFVRPTHSSPTSVQYGYRFANNTRYKSIYVLDRSGGQSYDPYTASTGWSSSAHKTILILSKLAEVTNGTALLNWLKANAVKQ